MMRMAKVGAIDDQVWTEGDGPAAMVLSRWEYGTIAFWKPPDRIDYCGRRYSQGSITVPGTPASLAASFKAPRVQ